MTTVTYTGSKTGKVVEAQLMKTRLRPGAVPCIFPNFPSYLSTPMQSTSSETPYDRRLRIEAASLEDAVRRSIETHNEEEKKRS